MIRYQEFEASVKSIAPDFEEWRHLLPAIPIAFRLRLVYVLHQDFRLPDAFDIVISSQNLTDDKFEDFLAEARLSNTFLHTACKFGT